MICVEVHSNNVLTVRNDTFANAVSDSVKHETVKFLFGDNWKNHQKTAVFSAEGVEPINIVLDGKNELCVSEDECYIPFEVLKGEYFTLSVFGVYGDSLATSTQENIKVFTSGYALGDEPAEPTPNEYSQLVTLVTETKELAQSVRNDADNGLFNGEKGEKGDKGDKGDSIGVKTEQGGEIFNDVEGNTANKNAHAEGNKTKASGNASHTEGNQTIASGDLGSHAEGLLCQAKGESSHAEGQHTTAEGPSSHAEGSSTKAIGDQAHAEGIATSAKGKYSHSEGYGVSAIGLASHAEGGQTSAWGKYSHAGGNVTNAYADFSSSFGNNTRSDYSGQTALGRYNKKPDTDSVFTVGMGTSLTDRKNAFNVFADGHAEVEAVGDSTKSVATTGYVAEQISNISLSNLEGAFDECYQKIYPVGSVYTASNSTTYPSTLFGGNWEMLDKEFASSSKNGTKEFFESAANVECLSVHYCRAGHGLSIRLILEINTTLDDTGVYLGKFNWEAFGINALDFGFNDITAYSSAGNEGIISNIVANTGEMTQSDVINATSIASGKIFTFNLTTTLSKARMLDNACNKFYWKRVS